MGISLPRVRAACLCGVGAAGLLFAAANGCEPTVVIGTRFCSQPPSDGGISPNPDAAVAEPWSTGFENGFCDYAAPMGFCYTAGSGASFSLVTAPVHSGQYAAAFTVSADADAGTGGQARCVEQGVFPGSAHYGAWYYIPAAAVSSGNWNLLHFQGGVPGQRLPGVWDLSLVNLSDGGAVHLSFLDFLTGVTDNASPAPPIPIGQWFHLEVYFKRAKDTTGAFLVWQDGVLAVNLTGLATDNSDWGQWYVGNLATGLQPPVSTLYVDDVTIGPAP